jgi:hypothetical protein
MDGDAQRFDQLAGFVERREAIQRQVKLRASVAAIERKPSNLSEAENRTGQRIEG